MAGPTLKAELLRSPLPDDELVISSADRTTAVVLNPMGAVVVDLCDGHRSARDIAQFICDHIEGGELAKVTSDVREILAELGAAGMLQET